jgi:hypothetical protein
MSLFYYCWRHVVNNYLASTKIYFSFQDVLRDLTSLQPLTAPPSLIPRPSFVRPLTSGLAASVAPMTSNSAISSTIAYPSSSTAVIYTSASSSGTVSTSSAVHYPQVNSSTRPLRPFSVGPATAGSPSAQTLLNLKSLVKRRATLPPPYPRVVRTTATFVPPIETSTIVDYSPLDLSVRSNLTVVPSGLPVTPQPLASLGAEVQPEPSSSTMPHRIPILQRPRSRLAALLSAGPSTRPTPSSTPVIEVFYPLYNEEEGNNK